MNKLTEDMAIRVGTSLLHYDKNEWTARPHFPSWLCSPDGMHALKNALLHKEMQLISQSKYIDHHYCDIYAGNNIYYSGEAETEGEAMAIAAFDYIINYPNRHKSGV